jgi:hypothetical protein
MLWHIWFCCIALLLLIRCKSCPGATCRLQTALLPPSQSCAASTCGSAAAAASLTTAAGQEEPGQSGAAVDAGDVAVAGTKLPWSLYDPEMIFIAHDLIIVQSESEFRSGDSGVSAEKKPTLLSKALFSKKNCRKWAKLATIAKGAQNRPNILKRFPN